MNTSYPGFTNEVTIKWTNFPLLFSKNTTNFIIIRFWNGLTTILEPGTCCQLKWTYRYFQPKCFPGSYVSAIIKISQSHELGGHSIEEVPEQLEALKVLDLMYWPPQWFITCGPEFQMPSTMWWASYESDRQHSDTTEKAEKAGKSRNLHPGESARDPNYTYWD